MSYVYLLYCDNGRRTYIGATNDPDRRLRQHNRELSGGASSTHGKHWTRACYIGGFPDWNAALQFEWMWKFKSRKYPGLVGKLHGLDLLLQSGKSSSSSMPFVLWGNPVSLTIDAVGKIDMFHAIFHTMAQRVFPTIAMSSVVSNTDLSNLAVTVQLLRDEVMALKSRLEEALAAPAAAAHRPAKKEPKLIKKAAVALEVPTNTVVAASDAEDAAEAEAAPAAKAKKVRKPKAPASDSEVPTLPESGAESATATLEPKKRGRKPKATALATESSSESAVAAPAAEPKKRGRKPKAASDAGAAAP
jgi:predicted GIY-YIG superfamily endonuclease